MSLRENSALSPVGTFESSPGLSPGLGMRHGAVPKGRLKIRTWCSAVPRGTVELDYHYLGLSSWATFRRPYGTKCCALPTDTRNKQPIRSTLFMFALSVMF
jgi:hypothetical protein